jgi:RNA polymerase sigma-70 factor (ECF subfamily)
VPSGGLLQGDAQYRPPAHHAIDGDGELGCDRPVSEASVTGLLHAWRAGDRGALDALMPLVYGELHRLAAGHLRGERPGHTFRPTELVAEAYLRLAAGHAPETHDRVHFYAIAARVMRQVLVDHARRRNAGKRGDGEAPVTLDEDVVGGAGTTAVLELDEALAALAALDERKAQVIELHYFGGMTQEEIAAALDVHVNTIARDLTFARAWIKRRLDEKI